ncbi:hypothetical protein [Methanopyrus sp.]
MDSEETVKVRVREAPEELLLLLREFGLTVARIENGYEVEGPKSRFLKALQHVPPKTAILAREAVERLRRAVGIERPRLSRRR